MDELDFAKRATILVVDDMPDNLALMSTLLKRDYQVKIANGGENALKIAMSDSPPDLILLDIMMPGMDGYEVCRRLKSDPATKNIQVIFVTAKTEVDDEQKGLELGAIDYITKPISPSVVMARVKNHLALKAMADFLHDQDGWDTAERLAYTLKSLSGNVGLADVQQMAEKLVVAIKARRSCEEVDVPVEGQPTHLGNLVAQLEQKLPEEQSRTAIAFDQEKLKAVCEKLETLLTNNDAEATDVLDANAELLDAAFPKHCHKIDNNIRSFNFEAALVTLRAAIATSAR